MDADFSELDGSAFDEDGAQNGVLTTSELKLKGQDEIRIDVPNATFAVAGTLRLQGNARIRTLPGTDSGPQVTILCSTLSTLGNSTIDLSAVSVGGRLMVNAIGSITVGGNSTLSAFGLGMMAGGGDLQLNAADVIVQGSAIVAADGQGAGGRVLLCAAGDLTVTGNTMLSASATGSSSAGGSIDLQADQNVLVLGDSAFIEASGGQGGSISLVACADTAETLDGVHAITVGGVLRAVGFGFTGRDSECPGTRERYLVPG